MRRSGSLGSGLHVRFCVGKVGDVAIINQMVFRLYNLHHGSIIEPRIGGSILYYTRLHQSCCCPCDFPEPAK